MTARGFVGGLIAGSLLGMAVGMMVLPEARGGASERMARGSRELGMRAQRMLSRAGMRTREMMPKSEH